MRFLFVCLFSIYFAVLIPAQNQDVISSIDQFIAAVFEHYTEESGEDLNFDTFYDELIVLSQHPLNLNNSTREELEKMMFLSNNQIENILYYRYKFGELSTIYELQLIEGLDMTDIRRMLPFVILSKGNDFLDPLKFNEVFKYGRNELLTRFDRVLEQKKGYFKTESDTSIYAGNSMYHHFKYRFQYKDRVLTSLTAEKDAGEMFWGKLQKGYDFYSASIQVKRLGIIQNVILGDYQASFGQGLVLQQGFGGGKSSMTTQVLVNNTGFKRYGSTNEFNFFRGCAVSLQLNQTNLHVFYSNKLIDGNIENDVFTGFYKTGYHRTITEFEKRNTVRQAVYGGNFTITRPAYQVGVSSVMMNLSHDLLLKSYPYNIFYFQGNRQLVSGINYRLRYLKFNVFGEAAITNQNGLAVINGLTFSPISRVNIAMLHRYYAPEFNAFFASAFSENSVVGNEQGFYIGVEILPFKKWKIAAYADSYRFPWVKYGIDFPSFGKDFFMQANYTPSLRTTMFWRAKYEQKLKSKSGTTNPTQEIEQGRKASLRYQLLYEKGNIKFKHIIDGNLVSHGTENLTYGLTALQEVSFYLDKIPFSVDLSYLFFDAVKYENRSYLFEKDVLYAFSIPMFSGLGSKYYINLRYDFSPNVSCWFKISQLLYADDREKIGSGHEQISRNKKTEIKLLLRWKFKNY
ncbi:MAG: helix-hairpin-helix domain-containing protein [Paludibacter sp.]|nr:helix-hairpin-helix domain-containing protein [Paludibacter sp.]